jgi:hypothetical protein
MRHLLHSRRNFLGWDSERKERVLGSLIEVINETLAVGHGCVWARGTVRDWEGTYSGHILSTHRLYEIGKVSEEFAFRHRLGAIAFESPKRFPPLQAADLLAYETRRKFIDWKDSTKPFFRRSLIKLESQGRITYCVHGREELEPVMERFAKSPEYRREMEQSARKQVEQAKRNRKKRGKKKKQR